jgi:NitT/TauT family transport system substrate-binding protein
MRRNIGFLLGGLFLLLLAGCSPVIDEAASAEKPVSIKLCLSTSSANQLVPVVAKQAGLFAARGLDVEVLSVENGSDAAVALVTGDVDLCQMGATGVVGAVAAGVELKIVAGIFNEHIYSLWVPPAIQTAADLRGTAVAISQPGSASDTLIRITLRALGLEPDVDVQVNSVGGQSERLAAILSGAASGGLFTPPETLKAQARGLHLLFDMAALDQPYQHLGIVGNRAWIAANRPAVVQLVAALTEAIALIKRDRAQTQTILAQYLSLDPVADVAILQETYDALYIAHLPDVPRPTLAGIATVIETEAWHNPAAAALNPADLLDLSIIDELERDGFFQRLNDGAPAP